MRARVTTFLTLLVGVIVGVLFAPAAVQAATNYFDVTKAISGSSTAYCGAGWRVTGGGVSALPNDYYGTTVSDEYHLTSSYPSSTTGWKATAVRIHGSYSSTNGWRFAKYGYSPTVHAICVR